MEIKREGLFVPNLGNFTKGWGIGRLVFRFGPCAELLLNTEALGADRFPFDREMTLMVFLIWVLWPEDDAKQKCAARFAAGLVTFRKRLADGRFDESNIEDLTSLLHRFEEEWYRQFYNSFFKHLGGLASLLEVNDIHGLDRLADKRRAELNSSLDMIEFFAGSALLPSQGEQPKSGGEIRSVRRI